MKRILVFTFLNLNVFFCLAQKQHLEPVFLDKNNNLDTYYISLFDNLYEGLEKKNSFRYAVVPSFDKEYGFCVESKKSEYFIVSTSLSESYWYSENKKEVKFFTERNKIDKELFDQISQLFKLLEKRTKEYDEMNFITDGESYYFMTTDKKGKVKIGKTYSPSDHSLMGRLIYVCNKLYNFKKNQNYDFKMEINNLISALEK